MPFVELSGKSELRTKGGPAAFCSLIPYPPSSPSTTSFVPMSRSPSIHLPAITLADPPQGKHLRSRGRSNSIVKVEHVGDRVEEVLDRDVYMNINADWVNAKGAFRLSICIGLHSHMTDRSMADPRRAHRVWQNLHRHLPRHDPPDQLVASQLAVSRSTFSIPRS